MTDENTTNAAGTEDEASSGSGVGGHLDRLWSEVKDVTRQLEAEARRGGRIAQLRFELRGLRRDLGELTSRLGRMIYDAQRESERRPALARVPGYDELIAEIDRVCAQMRTREDEIEALRNSDAEREREVA